MHPTSSYFNPVSARHYANRDFKTIRQREKAVIIVLTILTAIFSLPVAMCTATAVFRLMTEHYVQKREKSTVIVITKTTDEVTTVVSKPLRKSPRLIAKKKKEALPLVSPTPTKKGYIVSVLGRERLLYWCPKIGAVAGFFLGFYTTNLAQNYVVFFERSQSTQQALFNEAASMLSEHVKDGVPQPLDLSNLPTSNDSAVRAHLAAIDALLVKARDVNIKSHGVLEGAVNALAANAQEANQAKILSLEGAKALASFAKVASYGDVPISILSIANYFGGCVGACGGYVLGSSFAHWLDSDKL